MDGFCVKFYIGDVYYSLSRKFKFIYSRTNVSVNLYGGPRAFYFVDCDMCSSTHCCFSMATVSILHCWYRSMYLNTTKMNVFCDRGNNIEASVLEIFRSANIFYFVFSKHRTEAMATQAASVPLNMFTRPDPRSGMKYRAIILSCVGRNIVRNINSRQKYWAIIFSVLGRLNTRNPKYTSKRMSCLTVHKEFVFLKVLTSSVSRVGRREETTPRDNEADG